jgi:hypothetical protein
MSTSNHRLSLHFIKFRVPCRARMFYFYVISYLLLWKTLQIRPHNVTGRKHVQNMSIDFNYCYASEITGPQRSLSFHLHCHRILFQLQQLTLRLSSSHTHCVVIMHVYVQLSQIYWQLMKYKKLTAWIQIIVSLPAVQLTVLCPGFDPNLCH